MQQLADISLFENIMNSASTDLGSAPPVEQNHRSFFTKKNIDALSYIPSSLVGAVQGGALAVLPLIAVLAGHPELAPIAQAIVSGATSFGGAVGAHELGNYSTKNKMSRAVKTGLGGVLGSTLLTHSGVIPSDVWQHIGNIVSKEHPVSRMGKYGVKVLPSPPPQAQAVISGALPALLPPLLGGVLGSVLGHSLAKGVELSKAKKACLDSLSGKTAPDKTKIASTQKLLYDVMSGEVGRSKAKRAFCHIWLDGDSYGRKDQRTGTTYEDADSIDVEKSLNKLPFLFLKPHIKLKETE